jgi:glycosyltransferase involved in cell wall biosynthesis
MANQSFLLISDSYPPVLGGSEIEAQRVCSGMIRRGHHTLVLCAGGPPMPDARDWVDPAGVPVRILTRSSRGRWRDLTFALQVAWNIWRERHNYRIVYFLMQGLHLAAGLPVARLLGKPILMKFGGSGVIPLMNRSRVGRLELYWLKHWASRLMVLNQGMIDEALAYGFPPQLLSWMPNPTDTEQFRPPVNVAEKYQIRSQLGLDPATPIALYVGRLAPEKGLHWLIEAFGLVCRQNPSYCLVLLGDGSEREGLTALAASVGLNSRQIIFAGARPIAEVALFCKASDVFALTSPSEGFSCALAEAMSAGLPSVVSEIPANSQLIKHEVSGLMVPTGDVPAIADALLRLLADPALCARFGAAARSLIVDNFSLNRVVLLYEDLFSDILKSSARPPENHP